MLTRGCRAGLELRTLQAMTSPPALLSQGGGLLPRVEPTPRWWPGAARGAAVAGLVVAGLLWVRGGGLTGLLGGGWVAVQSAGRLTALVSAYLLLLQVLLMARIPMVERSFGQDSLARTHRWTGFGSFVLMLAHLALSTAGFAATLSVVGLAAQFGDFVVNWPGLLLATAATAALIMVVVTSIRRVRRRLRYESWHLLHLYAYLGVGLALPHMLWVGSDFSASPAARAYWWGLYGIAAGSIAIFRVWMPLRRTIRHRLRVDRVVPEAHGLVSVYLRGRHLESLPVRAGQFFVWRFLETTPSTPPKPSTPTKPASGKNGDDEDGWLSDLGNADKSHKPPRADHPEPPRGRLRPGWSRGNPFSLSGPPRGDQLRITVKRLGDGSSRVAGLAPGTRVIIEGPYGRLTAESYRGGPVTMLACGVGITPLLALLWDLPYGYGQATLVYRARDAGEVAFLDEIRWLAERRGVRLVPMIGPRARDGSWLAAEFADYSDAEALTEIAPDIAGHDIYLCGPDPWTDAVRAAARAAGVPAAMIHRERFGW